MDFLTDKVNSVTGAALSGLNEMRRKRGSQASNKNRPEETERRRSGEVAETSNPSAIVDQSRLVDYGTCQQAPVTKSPGNFAGFGHAVAFGGYSRSAYACAPPSIGFKEDLPCSSKRPPDRSRTTSPNMQQFSQAHPNSRNPELDLSDPSLYAGDAWARLWFQRVLILCLLRLISSVSKLYEDFQATKVYSLTGQNGHFLLSATTLFLPTVVFTIYRVGRYLQLTLPSIRESSQQLTSREEGTSSKLDERGSNEATSLSAKPTNSEMRTRKHATSSDDDAQITRALMSQSPDQSIRRSEDNSPTPTPITAADEDGLVTARQTPTQMDEFHDSKSNQELPFAPTEAVLNGSSTLASKLTELPLNGLESINVERFGDLPDKQTMRLVIGTSEQLLHGSLFLFWQLKRQVDVLGYLVERACLWRKPADHEKEEVSRLRTGSDGLEWFEDFYAAFLAILTQVYTFNISQSNTFVASNKNFISNALNQTSVGPLPAKSSLGDQSGANNLATDQMARTLSGLFGAQALSGNSTFDAKDMILVRQMIVSSFVIISLLICVRRRDDGILTTVLSMLGWGSLFAGRILVISLAFAHIGWPLMLTLVILHVLGISGWIYSIALDSHNGRPSELADEVKWTGATRETGNENLELGYKPREDTPGTAHHRGTTSNWSLFEHLVLLTQILALFGVPSLFYWPVMFNLKLHLRAVKYLALIVFENGLLITALYYHIDTSDSAIQLYLMGAVVVFSIMGFLFICLYMVCKPDLTEYFARADELLNEAEQSGIYYEFCSRVFKLPDPNDPSFANLLEQTEKIVEEKVDDCEVEGDGISPLPSVR